MIKTYGLTHLALSVKDIQKASDFYHKVLGVREMYRADGFIQVQTPDSHDIIVFEERKDNENRGDKVLHFGFRLVKQEDISVLAKEIEAAGGDVIKQGEFCAGEPYVFFIDPDGNEVEIWYEQVENPMFN